MIAWCEDGKLDIIFQQVCKQLTPDYPPKRQRLEFGGFKCRVRYRGFHLQRLRLYIRRRHGWRRFALYVPWYGPRVKLRDIPLVGEFSRRLPEALEGLQAERRDKEQTNEEMVESLLEL